MSKKITDADIPVKITLKQQVQILQRQLDDASVAIVDLERNLSNTTAEKNRLRNELNHITGLYERNKIDLQNETIQNHELTKKLEEANEEVRSLNASVKTYQMENLSLMNKLKGCDVTISILQKIITDALRSG